MIIEKNTEYYAASTSKDRSAIGVVAMLEDWITKTGCVPRTLRLDGAKEFFGSEMRDFCRKHNITLQLVPAYNHLLQCWVEGVIRITKSHTRVALKQSRCPLRFWARSTNDFTKKRNTLWARKEADGTLTAAFERMQPVGVCNSWRAIAVPFGCKVILQIPRESSLCTDGSHSDQAMEGMYVGVDDSTSSIHPRCLQIEKRLQTNVLSATRTCSSTRASSQQKMPGACIRKMMLQKRISSQPTLDRTNMPLRHQKQIHWLPAKARKISRHRKSS